MRFRDRARAEARRLLGRLRSRHHLTSRQTLADAVLALGLLVFGLIGTAKVSDNFPGRVPVDGLALALVVVAVLGLAVRRRWPLAVLVTSAVSTAIYLVLGYPYGPILISLFVAVYTGAAYRPTRPAAIAGGAALAALLVHVFVSRMEPEGLTGVLPGSAWVVVPFALGVTIRLNREAVARNRAEQARRVADDERLRIAQEVHDVVGHGLAAINMQAEIALHLLPTRPEQAETALTAISRTSREALDELRATLSAVRQGPVRAPAAGLSQVAALAERLHATGLPVTVLVDGPPRPLPVAVDLAGYRVVQEALTNVLRHAGAATATVRIGYLPAEVTLEVTDTGRGGPDVPRFGVPRFGVPGSGGPGFGGPGAGTGQGLIGMRERVDALGGRLEAGPVPDGGFRVYARLPAQPR